MLRKKRWREVLLALGIAFSLLVLPPMRSLVMAPALFVNVAVPKGAWRPLELISREPTRESYVLNSPRGVRILVDLYVPASGSKNPAVLLYAPIAQEGQRDFRLVNMAESLAQIGFIVTIPLQEEDPRILSRENVTDLVAAYQNLLLDPRVDKKRTGFFSISYSNGPVFLAATDRQVKDDVAFLVSFAGYFDLSETLRALAQSPGQIPAIPGEEPPGEWVRDLVRVNLRLRGFSEEEISTFLTQPEEFDAFLANHPELRAEMQALSPRAVIDQVDVRTIIAHSTNDPAIPHMQSIQLAESLQNRVPVTLSIVNMFEHGELLPFTARTLVKNYLPSFFAGYRFLYQLHALTWRVE